MNQIGQTDQSQASTSGDELDRELLNRINDGDREAFRELYDGYYHRLLRFMRRVTGQLDLAQEGVNDVLLVVWQNGRSFGGRSRVSTWIMGIGYRKALKLLEGSRRRSARFTAADFDDFATEPSEDRDLRDLLECGLSQLSPEQRAVVELTYFSGCSYLEIAAIADCPVNTVKTRMFHARARLRKLLPALSTDESLS